MTKYFRVKKTTPLREEGAIISNKSGGYKPVQDVRDKTPVNGTEYLSSKIIEHPGNADFFERVYKDSAMGTIFRTADKVKEAYEKSFK